MNTLAFLHQRASIPARYLSEPAPSAKEVEELITAAVTAPDHAAMRPWRFIVIEGQHRETLGEIFVEAAKQSDPQVTEDKLSRILDKPLRAPLIIVVVATITENHPKTPTIEQTLSAGAAATHLQLAATALGYGSVWLTGPNASDLYVKASLGIEAKDELIGFIYIGTPKIDAPKPKRPNIEDHLSYWQPD